MVRCLQVAIVTASHHVRKSFADSRLHRADLSHLLRPDLRSLRPRAVSADFEPTPILQLRAGQRIEHNRFGYGVIKEISGSSSDLKANILFDEHGEKILLLKYAKIRAIDL